MNSFRVLKITNNLEEYPECEKDTLEFPYLVGEVGDEMEIFILCVETNEYWVSNDFFSMVKISNFYSHDFKSE